MGMQTDLRHVWRLESIGYMDGSGGTMEKNHGVKQVDWGSVPLSEWGCHFPCWGKLRPWGGAGAG